MKVGGGAPVQVPGSHVRVVVPLIVGATVLLGGTAGTARAGLVALALPPALLPVTSHVRLCVASAPTIVYVLPVAPPIALPSRRHW